MAAKKVSKTKTAKKPVSDVKRDMGQVEKESVKEMGVKKSSSKLYTLLTVVVIIGGLFYLFKGFFVVATVNGTPITRMNLVGRLEKQGGASVLDSLVTETLILQAAKEKNLEILPVDIDAQVEKYRSQMSGQGQDLDAVLEAQGMTLADFKNDIKIQLIVEKIFADQIAVSEEEVEKYLTDYSSMMGELTEDEQKTAAREQLKQQKLTDSFYSWIEELKTNATINYWREY